ncbi:MAG: MurR/RpiR family transcriptional regulator [Lachnospiraceae bacterium]
MESYENLVERIERKKKEFSKGQKRLAVYLLKYYDKAAFFTAQKLGKEAGVSESTVVRFAYQLEYEGYPQLQQELRVMAKRKSNSIQRLELAKDHFDNEDLLPKILQIDADRLRDTIHSIDKNEFNRAVDMIENANMIYILGARSAGFLAGLLGYYLDMIFDHVKVVNANATSDTFEQICRMKENDLFIAISFPRYSKRTVQALSFAKKQGASTIAITDSEQSPITADSDCSLIAKSDVMAIVDSLVGPQSVINALVVALSIRKKDEVEKRLKLLEELWNEYDVYEKESKS